MKNDIKKYVSLVVILSVTIGVLFGIYYLYTSYVNKKNEYKEVEQYEANQVFPVYITKDQMANIYLSDFASIMMTNPAQADNLLNKEYREKKFASVDNFRNYIKSIGTPSIKSFAIKNSNGYEYFYIYDTNNNLYIFRTKGVMQYEVFLDETTVEV